MNVDGPSRAGLETVLAKIGRASTPAVPENKTGMSLSRLLRNPRDNRFVKPAFYGVIGAELRGVLEQNKISFTQAIPGDSFSSLPNEYSGTVLIDRQGFTSGVWLGLEFESGIRLREEVYELCRVARSNGIPVWFLDVPEFEKFPVSRIKSACDVVFPYTSKEDFEEGAPLSNEFELICSEVSLRFEFEESK